MKQQLLLILLISLTLFDKTFVNARRGGNGPGPDGEDGEDGEMPTGLCYRNPLLHKLKKWAHGIEKDLDGEARHKLNDALKHYSNFDGELGLNLEQCGDFEGQTTCCSHKLLRMFPKLIKGFIKNKIRGEHSKPIYKLFLNSLLKGSGKCLGKEFAKSMRDGEELQNIVREYGNCEKKKLHGQARFMAGMMCGLCFGPDQLEDAFDGLDGDNPRLIISTSNYDEFDGEISDNFRCVNKVNKKLYKFIGKLISQIPDTPRCQEFGKRIKAAADGEELSKPPPNNCRAKAEAFGGGCFGDQDGEEGDFSNLDPEKIKGGKRPQENNGSDSNNSNNGVRGGNNNGGDNNNNNNGGQQQEQTQVRNGGRNNGRKRRNRLLDEEESSDFVFSDSPSAYSVFAPISEVGSEEDLLGEENVEFQIDDDEIEQQIEDNVDDFYEDEPRINVKVDSQRLFLSALSIGALLFALI